MNHIRIKNKGFTLIEMLVTVAVFSIVALIVMSFARDVYYYDSVFSKGLTSYDEARKVLSPMTSEIRSASPSSLGSYAIEKADVNEFIFYSDIDNNGNKERIRYFLDGNILKKGVIKPTGSPLQYVSGSEVITNIITGVSNGATPIFTYYNSNYSGSGNPLVQPVSILEVRLVKINIMIDIDPNRPPAPIVVTTQVSIRNLKDNL